MPTHKSNYYKLSTVKYYLFHFKTKCTSVKYFVGMKEPY